MSARWYTVLHVGLVQGVEKHCGSSVMKVESHSINGKNGFLKAQKERQSWGVIGEGPWTDEVFSNQVMFGHGAFIGYLFHMRGASNAPTAIEEDEMMMPGTPWLSVQHFNCSEKTLWPPHKRWVRSFLHRIVCSQSCYRMPKYETKWPSLLLGQCVTSWSQHWSGRGSQ